MKKNKVKIETEFKTKVITCKIEDSKLIELDKFAKKMRMNRSQLTRNLIVCGLDDLKIMNSTGLLTLTLKGIDAFGIVKELFLKDQYEIKDDKIIFEL
jgi:hypothetical protein